MARTSRHASPKLANFGAFLFKTTDLVYRRLDGICHSFKPLPPYTFSRCRMGWGLF